MKLVPIILAAGEGKRMKSPLPKVLHKICDRELVRYALEAAAIGEQKPVVVVGCGAHEVKKALGDEATYALQEKQLGTGHAVMMAREYLMGDYALVLAGDMPLLRRETLEALCQRAMSEQLAACLLSTVADDPTGYGRILRDEAGNVTAIVEERDASAVQKAIKEINASVYCFEIPALLGALDSLDTHNAQGEYYLTDCIAHFVRNGLKVGALTTCAEECSGVNDRVQLAACSAIMRRRIARAHLLAGVNILDPDATHIGADVVIGENVTIYPNNVIEGKAVIGDGAILYPGNFIEGGVIGAGTKIGPNAHIRPGTVTGKNCRVGNFVELKNVMLDDGAKVSHLAYCGDGSIGKGSNISCGVIFSNYDGKRKYRTVVGEHAFVGCNVNLVAPVEIGDGAYIAAGSTITENVPAGALGIARERQTNKDGWVKKHDEANK